MSLFLGGYTVEAWGCMTEAQLIEDHQRRLQAWTEKVAAATGKKRMKLISKKPTLKKPGSGCAGLWRKATKKRPAMMTDYIREKGLLPSHEIDHLQQSAPIELVKRQEHYNMNAEVLNWHDFLEMFTEEDALDEQTIGCSLCMDTCQLPTMGAPLWLYSKQNSINLN